MTRAIFLPLCLATALATQGYDFLTRNGLRWRDGDIPISLQLDTPPPSSALSDGNTSWNDVAQEALDLWNAPLGNRVRFTNFTSVRRGDGDGDNQVFFSPNIYGHRFGADVLAVTTTWRIGSERVEGDTIFNDAIQWDSYRGPIDYTVVDLRRVSESIVSMVAGVSRTVSPRRLEVGVSWSSTRSLLAVTVMVVSSGRSLERRVTRRRSKHKGKWQSLRRLTTGAIALQKSP